MKKIDSLQGLRGIAIIGIFLSHTTSFLGENFSSLFIYFFKLGPIGVSCFFILSGFLLGYLGGVIKKESVISAIKKSYKKIKKLYGLHIAMFILSFIAKFPETVKDWVLSLLYMPFNLSLTQDFIPWVGVVDSFNGPSWFLSAFIGVWILVFMWPRQVNNLQFFSRKRLISVIFLLLALQSVYIIILSFVPFDSIPHGMAFLPWFNNRNPFFAYSEFIIGCCFGALIRKGFILYLNISYIQLFLLFAFIICILILPSNSFYFYSIFEIIILLGIYISLFPKSVGARLLSSQPLVWLGNISGCLFLIHGSVNFFLKRFLPVEMLVPYLFFFSLSLSLVKPYCVYSN